MVSHLKDIGKKINLWNKVVDLKAWGAQGKILQNEAISQHRELNPRAGNTFKGPI